MKKKDDYFLDLSSRRKIYHFILKHPGTYLQEISREIKIPKSTIDYHLRYLMKMEVITVKSKGKFNRYYIKQDISRYEKESLSALRSHTALHMALILSLKHVRTRKQFSQELEKSQSTVTFHLKKLIEANVIEKFYEDNRVKYRLKDEKATDKLLVKYKEGLLDELVITFYEYYAAWSKVKWIRLVIGFLNNKENAKLHEDFLNEMFPHPYWG